MGDTKRIEKIPRLAPMPKRKRVAAYARVSLEKDAMLHSLAAQVSHYSAFIQQNPAWIYAGVYADEGLTGTKESRPEFQKLLHDCRAEKIDLIIVKSISRFARNAVTLLSTVRELKGLGIDVFFERENIHSMSGDGELMLSILASFAQEESLSVSENCKWHVRKKFEQGEVTGMRMYGYRLKDRVLTIVPEEADVVRRIFDMYLQGMGKELIANTLTIEGVPAPRGTTWHFSVIHDLLANEKYAGNMLLGKCFVEDHLTKKQKRNNGEMPKYWVENSHEAIIDRETFDAVQAEMQRRASLYWIPGEKANLPLNGLITCGICGKHFQRKANKGAPYWVCYTYLRRRKEACPSRKITERVLFPILESALETDDLRTQIHRISEIRVFPDGKLALNIDGESIERTWENPSRSESWTEEMRVAQGERTKQQFAKRKGGRQNAKNSNKD